MLEFSLKTGDCPGKENRRPPPPLPSEPSGRNRTFFLPALPRQHQCSEGDGDAQRRLMLQEGFPEMRLVGGEDGASVIEDHSGQQLDFE